MKHRLRIALSPKVERQLELAASRPGSSRSEIVETALVHLFDPGDAEARLAVLVRRFDAINRMQGRLMRDTGIIAEALGLFIRMYLAATPPFVGDAASAQQTLGAKRFEAFIAELGRRIGRDELFTGKIAALLGEPDAANANESSVTIAEMSDAA
jgi:hypothetical protein